LGWGSSAGKDLTKKPRFAACAQFSEIKESNGFDYLLYHVITSVEHACPMDNVSHATERSPLGRRPRLSRGFVTAVRYLAREAQNVDVESSCAG